jgi:hypothetical protein
MVPVSQVANVTLIDARTIGVQPWEKKHALQKVEKAIRDSDLGLNPSQGDMMRVPMPALTEERRKELIKVVRGEGENARVAMRNLRRDAITHLKDALKKGDDPGRRRAQGAGRHPEADRPVHRRCRQDARAQRGRADAGLRPVRPRPHGSFHQFDASPKTAIFPGTSPSSWMATAAGREALHAPRCRPPQGCRDGAGGACRCLDRGVGHYLTLFAFSSENWRRPPEEVSLC